MIFYQLKGNCDQKHPNPPPEFLSKNVNWRFYTKLFIRSSVLLFVLMTTFTPFSNAQTITIKANKNTLRSVMNKIEQQSGYDFWYNKGSINESEKVSIEIKEQSLEAALKTLLIPRKLSFEIVDKTIFLKPLTGKTPDNPSKSIIIIEGAVVDKQGKPIPNATIKIKGTTIMTSADESGRFKISRLTENGILIATSLGYLPNERPFSSNDKTLNFILQSDENKLEDVQVVSTGYQNLPKERVTGSFAQPIKEVFESRVSTDVLSKLKGITSGLLFNSNTSRVNGGENDLSIRGRNTIFANDQPLIILDNFPYSGDINNINPNEIESITVLKDAAAASIWGVRAGNGVIVINTKQGKFEQPMKISFNTNLTIGQKPDLEYNQNQLDAQNYINLEQYLFSKGYYDNFLTDVVNFPVVSPMVALLQRNRLGLINTQQLQNELNNFSIRNINTDVSNFFYKTTSMQQYSVNLAGGAKSLQYSFSGGYDKNVGPLNKNGLQRITLNTQNTYRLFNHLEASIGLNFIKSDIKKDNTFNSISGSLFPYERLADEEGNFLPISYGFNTSYLSSALANGFLDWRMIPLQEIGLQENKTRDLNFRGNLGLKYTIIGGLSVEVKYLYQSFNSQSRIFQPQSSYAVRNLINRYSTVINGKVTGYNIPIGGTLGLTNSSNEMNSIRGQLSYNRRIKKHELNGIIGYELSEATAKSHSSSYLGYNDDIGTFAVLNNTATYNLNPSGSGSIGNGLNLLGTVNRIRSSFVNVGYTFEDKYSVSASARIDGSNYFGVSTNHKSVPLWSVGAKWEIDKERFYKIDWLPSLKLRTTFGYNGNLDGSITGITTFRYVNNAQYTNLPYAVTSNIGNPDLRWEKTALTNIAVDFATIKNRITGSIEFYRKKGTDIIGFKNFPTSSGITTLKGNYADMRAQGLDLTLTSQNLRSEFSWQTTFQLSLAKDKVIRYDVTPTTAQIVASDGNSSVATPLVSSPVFGIYSYRWGGLNAVNGNPIGYFQGNESEEYVAITSRTPISDLKYSGTARPTVFGGLSNQFSYRGLALNVQIIFKAGYYFRKPTINYSLITSGGGASLNVNRDYVRRWQEPGDEKNTQVPSQTYPSSPTRDSFYQYSEINVLKGDHVRLQDISLSYDIKKTSIPKLPFQNLKIYFYANNIGIIWRANKEGYDPDAVPASLDRSTFVQPRTFAIGLKGSF
jgi:TonB-linked SusC/RagA family outer membrane protein